MLASPLGFDLWPMMHEALSILIHDTGEYERDRRRRHRCRPLDC